MNPNQQLQSKLTNGRGLRSDELHYCNILNSLFLLLPPLEHNELSKQARPANQSQFWIQAEWNLCLHGISLALPPISKSSKQTVFIRLLCHHCHCWHGFNLATHQTSPASCKGDVDLYPIDYQYLESVLFAKEKNTVVD